VGKISKYRVEAGRGALAAIIALTAAGIAGPYCSASAASEPAAAPSAGINRGYVVTYFQTAHSFSLTKDEEGCPDGYTPGLAEVTLDSLPAGRLKDHLAKSQPDRIAWAVRAANPERCRTPWNFERPPVREVHSKVAFGMNLDGVTAEDDPGGDTTCAHKKFVSPAGGMVDNQFYRAFGCTHAYNVNHDYSGNLVEDQHHGARKDGEMTILIDVRGAPNSEDVEVGFYSSEDPTPFNNQGKPMQKASLSISDNPRYRAVTHGKLVGTVLTTDPVDLHFYFNWVHAHDDSEEYFIRAARLRMELRPDGTAKGSLGGYWDVDKAFFTIFGHAFPYTPLEEASFGYTCPAAYAGLRKYADGFKNPKTGQCDGISTVFDIEATQAFVIHPKDQDRRAAVTAGAPSSAR
jgi:hypothetical protein